MKTLLIGIVFMFAPFTAATQNYYGEYGRQYNPQPQIQNNITAKQIQQQDTYMRRQNDLGMRELEMRSNLRRYDMINGGTGMDQYGYPNRH